MSFPVCWFRFHVSALMRNKWRKPLIKSLVFMIQICEKLAHSGVCKFHKHNRCNGNQSCLNFYSSRDKYIWRNHSFHAGNPKALVCITKSPFKNPQSTVVEKCTFKTENSNGKSMENYLDHHSSRNQKPAFFLFGMCAFMMGLREFFSNFLFEAQADSCFLVFLVPLVIVNRELQPLI